MTQGWRVYGGRRVAPLLFLGFASGLPLALTSGTLQAWATVSQVSLQSIGFLTLAGTAYTLKFLWAPLVDRYAPPWLGRRRGWVFLAQGLLAASIAAMGLFDPGSELRVLALLAVWVAFLSATQDIAFDAYSTDVLRQDERAAGAALKVMGYRLAMVVSGGLALILADQWLGWGAMYMLMGDFILCGGAHIGDGAGKIQFHAGKRVITVDDDRVVGNIGHFIDNKIIRIFRTTFKMHTDDHVIGK